MNIGFLKNLPPLGNFDDLLQTVRTTDKWNEWIIWMLDGVYITSKQTIKLIRKIKLLMNQFQNTILTSAKNIYSKHLLESLFKHPYTKIKFIENDLAIHRQTATKYLNTLVKIGLLTPQKIGKSKYYINDSLYNLLIDRVE